MSSNTDTTDTPPEGGGTNAEADTINPVAEDTTAEGAKGDMAEAATPEEETIRLGTANVLGGPQAR